MTKPPEADNSQKVNTALMVNNATDGELLDIPMMVTSVKKISKDNPASYLGQVFDKSPSKITKALKDQKLYNFLKAATLNPKVDKFINRNQRTMRGNFFGGEASHAAGGARQYGLKSSLGRMVSSGFALVSILTSTSAYMIPAAVFGIGALFHSLFSIARGEKGEADVRMLSHYAAAEHEFKQVIRIYNESLDLNLSEEQMDIFAQRQAARFAKTVADGVDTGRLGISVGVSLIMSVFLILPTLEGVIDELDSKAGLGMVLGVNQFSQAARRLAAIQAVYLHISSALTFKEAIQQTSKALADGHYAFEPGVVYHEETIEISHLIESCYCAFYNDLSALAPKGTEINPSNISESIKTFWRNNPMGSLQKEASFLFNIPDQDTTILRNILNSHRNKTGAANDYYQHRFNKIQFQEAKTKEKLALLTQINNSNTKNEAKQFITTHIKRIDSNQRALFDEAISFFKQTGYVDAHQEITYKYAKSKGWVNALLESYESYRMHTFSNRARLDNIYKSFDTRITRLLKAINQDQSVGTAKQLSRRVFANADKYLTKIKNDKNLELAWEDGLSKEMSLRLLSKISQLDKATDETSSIATRDFSVWAPSGRKLLLEARKLFSVSNSNQDQAKQTVNSQKTSKTDTEIKIAALNKELELFRKKKDWTSRSENAKLTTKVIHELLTKPENHDLRPFIYNSAENYNTARDSSIAKPKKGIGWTSLANTLVNGIETALANTEGDLITANHIYDITQEKEFRQLALALLENYSHTNKQALAEAYDSEKDKLINALLNGLIIQTIDSAIEFFAMQLQPFSKKENRYYAKSITNESLEASQRIEMARIAKTYFDIKADQEEGLFEKLNELITTPYSNTIKAIIHQMHQSMSTQEEAEDTLEASKKKPQEQQMNAQTINQYNLELLETDVLPENDETESLNISGPDSEQMSANDSVNSTSQLSSLFYDDVQDDLLVTQENSDDSDSLETDSQNTEDSASAQRENTLNNEATYKNKTEPPPSAQATEIPTRRERVSGTLVHNNLKQFVNRKQAVYDKNHLKIIIKSAASPVFVEKAKERYATNSALQQVWDDSVSKAEEILKTPDLELSAQDKKKLTDHEAMFTQALERSDLDKLTHDDTKQLAETFAKAAPFVIVSMLKEGGFSSMKPEERQSFANKRAYNLFNNWLDEVQQGANKSFNLEKRYHGEIEKKLSEEIKELARQHPRALHEQVTPTGAADLTQVPSRQQLIKILQSARHVAANPAYADSLPKTHIQLLIKHQNILLPDAQISLTNHNKLNSTKRIRVNKTQKLSPSFSEFVKNLANNPLQEDLNTFRIKDFKQTNIAQLALGEIENRFPEINQQTAWLTPELTIEKHKNQPQQSVQRQAEAFQKLNALSTLKPSQLRQLAEISVVLAHAAQSQLSQQTENRQPLKDIDEMNQSQTDKRVLQENTLDSALPARRKLALNLYDARNNAIKNGRVDLRLYYPYDDYEVRVKEALIERLQNNNQHKLAKKLIKNRYEIPAIHSLETRDRKGLEASARTSTLKTKKTPLNSLNFQKRVLSRLNPYQRQFKNIKRSTAHSINTLIHDSLANQHKTPNKPSDQAWRKDIFLTHEQINLNKKQASQHIKNIETREALKHKTTNDLLIHNAHIVQTMIERAIAAPEDKESIAFLMNLHPDIASDLAFHSHTYTMGANQEVRVHERLQQVKNEAVLNKYNNIIV